MASADALANIEYFYGICTVDEAVRLKPIPVKTQYGIKSAYPLVEAINVDIDNDYALSSRDGSELKISGTTIHSLWADGEVCFFVDKDTLYLMTTDYLPVFLMNGLTTNARMSYIRVNNRVYMTNGTFIGKYESPSVTGMHAPSMNYKEALPAGDHIGYCKTRLFIGSGKVLYVADSLCDHYDIRYGKRYFKSDIKMILGVNDGVYVSDSENVYFINVGASPDEHPELFPRTNVLNMPAIPYSGCVVEAKYVQENIEGSMALWVSKEGIYSGDNKGNVLKVTPNYLMTDRANGSSAIRNINGVVHYMATLE